MGEIEIVRRNLNKLLDPRAGQYAVPLDSAAASATYATVANSSRIVRFMATKDRIITKIGFAVTTAAGADDACDVGIYSSSLVRLASAGATSGKLNSLGAKTVNLSASYTIRRGTIYYAGFSCGTQGGSAASLQSVAYASIGAGEIFGATDGLYEFGIMATAHPLPDPYVRSGASAGVLLAMLE